MASFSTGQKLFVGGVLMGLLEVSVASPPTILSVSALQSVCLIGAVAFVSWFQHTFPFVAQREN